MESGQEASLGASLGSHANHDARIKFDTIMRAPDGVVVEIKTSPEAEKARSIRASFFRVNPGSDLLSHTVTRAVPSAP
jgi:hypothetical protein